MDKTRGGGVSVVLQYTSIYPHIPDWLSEKDITENKGAILEKAFAELTK